MKSTDPTKTLSWSDRYPAVQGMPPRLVTIQTSTPPAELEIEAEPKPNWLLHYTVLWITLAVISAFFAYDQGWIARQTEIDAAKARSEQLKRSVEFPIEEVVKP